MARTKKDAKILNIKLDREIHEQLEKFCEESGLTKTIAVERILQHYFQEYFKRSKEDRTIFWHLSKVRII